VNVEDGERVGLYVVVRVLLAVGKRENDGSVDFDKLLSASDADAPAVKMSAIIPTNKIIFITLFISRRNL